jgi:hypothetical protein
MRILAIGCVVLALSVVPALAADECQMRQYEIDKTFGKRFDRTGAEVRSLGKQAMALCKAGKKSEAMKKYDEAAKKGGIVLQASK